MSKSYDDCLSTRIRLGNSTPQEGQLADAAPDLLAELEALCKTVADALDNMPYIFHAHGEPESLSLEAARAWRAKLRVASKSARAAIAKAGGEA